jgi:glycosyltransferase involved in cell wall biosynthesis
MRIVIDAIPVVPFGGFAVTLEGLLAGWDELGDEDEIHLLLAEGVEHEIPASINVHRFAVGKPDVVRRVIVQSRAGRKVCRDVGADVLLGAISTTAVIPVGCPKVITVHDLRHELRPEQFSRGRRLLRNVSYAVGYREASGLICISERTRADLLRLHPRLAKKPVFTVPWAADHVDHWPRREGSGEERYALAFGHFPNKGVERVIDAWRILQDRGRAMPAVLVGLPREERGRIDERIRSAGLTGVVEALPWLENEEFRARFASAGLIVFPSDFEGFGLPAVEAMRLGIPLVISGDEALREVTGGHAAVAPNGDALSLADAVSTAWATPKDELDRARAFVGEYHWVDVARATREALAEVAEAASPGQARRFSATSAN